MYSYGTVLYRKYKVKVQYCTVTVPLITTIIIHYIANYGAVRTFLINMPYRNGQGLFGVLRWNPEA